MAEIFAVPNVVASFGPMPAPFRLKVNRSFIDDVYRRVQNARPPVPVGGLDPEDTDGAPLSEFHWIRDYWLSTYDWKATEASINEKFQHFTTTVQAPAASHYAHPVALHFVHHRSPRADAIPLLFVHGWPGSFLEVEKILEPLTHPAEAGMPAFHVVAPSVPGYGFSPAPAHPGFGPIEAGHTFHALMQQLGYARYVMQAGDLGGIIMRYQAAAYPDQVVSVLSNFWLTQPSAADEARLEAQQTTGEESAYMARIAAYKTRVSGYRLVQQTAPLQLAYALTDSPLGMTMWMYSLMRQSNVGSVWTPQDVITWALMYIIPGPYGGLRMYKGMSAAGAFDAVEFGTYPFVPQPAALSEFPGDLWFSLPLEWAQRDGNVKKRFLHDRGGHFAAHEVPELLVQDIREWFGDREASGTKVFF